MSSSDEVEQISLDELIDRANAFAFYILAYDALLDHGVDFKRLPQFENLSDLYVRGELSSARYFSLLSDAVSDEIARSPFKTRPNVPDVGSA